MHQLCKLLPELVDAEKCIHDSSIEREVVGPSWTSLPPTMWVTHGARLAARPAEGHMTIINSRNVGASLVL